MIYNFKEYKHIFDTPMKRQQELVVARKIMDLLNKNKYDDLEKFIEKNNNYQDFLKKNNMTVVVKHFGNTLKEEDYIKILENLRILTKTKLDFDKEKIKTTNIDEKQFNSFKGKDKTYFTDNSRTDIPIEQQMEHLQTTSDDFETSDKLQNTENMFKELETKKDGLNLHYLYEINFESLSNEEKILYQLATKYQQNIKGIIKIDLSKGIIVDEENNISKIEKNDEAYFINNDDVDNLNNNITKNKPYQKTLTPTKNTIYNN